MAAADTSGVPGTAGMPMATGFGVPGAAGSNVRASGGPGGILLRLRIGTGVWGSDCTSYITCCPLPGVTGTATCAGTGVGGTGTAGIGLTSGASPCCCCAPTWAAGP